MISDEDIDAETARALMAVPFECPLCGGPVVVCDRPYPYAVMLYGRCEKCEFESEPRRTGITPPSPENVNRLC